MTEKVVRGLSRSLPHIVIISICLIWILPSFGLLVNSFRSRRDIVATGWWTNFKTPFAFTVENYVEVLTGKTQYGGQKATDSRPSILKDIITGQGMGRAFLNSLIISVPSTFIPILVASFAAYALAWMRFPGRDLLFILVVGLLVVPLQMTLIPILRLYKGLQLGGTFLGVWLAHTAYGLPYAIYLLRNFFRALPRDLFESASLDGASQFVIFYRIVIPLSIPSIASLAIFQFLWVWNDSIDDAHQQHDEFSGGKLALASGGGPYLHGVAPHLFLHVATILRPRNFGRLSQGLEDQTIPSVFHPGKIKHHGSLSMEQSRWAG